MAVGDSPGAADAELLACPVRAGPDPVGRDPVVTRPVRKYRTGSPAAGSMSSAAGSAWLLAVGSVGSDGLNGVS